MPFNAQGLMQRMHKWKNDYNNGIKIIASRMDEDTDSIVSGINDILQGKIKFRGPIKTIFGTKNKPSFSFSEEVDTGMYRPATRQLGVSVGGVEKINVSDGKTTVNGNMTVNGDMDVTGDMNVTGQLELDWETQINKGHNSNIDADKLDGQHGEYYTDPNNISGHIPTSKLSGSYGISITGNAQTATTASNANRLGGQTSGFYQNAQNINTGVLGRQRLNGTYDINVSGDVTGGRLGPNAINRSPQTERRNGWFSYTYYAGTPDAPFNQSGLFVFFNAFVNYYNGHQKGFFPQNGETNSVIPEFERLQVNGTWTPWRKIPKSRQDIASLLPPQSIKTVQTSTDKVFSITGDTHEQISEFNTTIRPTHAASRIKIDVNVAYRAYASTSSHRCDSVLALCRNSITRNELYKRNMVVELGKTNSQKESLSFSYIDKPGTTNSVRYMLSIDKKECTVTFNDRLTDSRIIHDPSRPQHSSVIVTDLGA